MDRRRKRLAEFGDSPDLLCCVGCERDESLRLLASVARKLEEIEELPPLLPALDLIEDAIDRLVAMEKEALLRVSETLWRALTHLHEADFMVSAASADTVYLIAGARTCIADFDRNGTVDRADVVAYLVAFLLHDPRADTNCDGRIDLKDYVNFLGAVLVGCG